ncbi:DUF4870 domain-containing protein [bacterium]|nr:DUF4870 domain-containing protein [bacterium]
MSNDIEVSTGYTQEDRIWAMLCHLASFVTFIPFGNIVAPLVIWMMKRDSSPLVADQGKEALNFQITMVIGYAVAIVLFFTVVLIPVSILMLVVLPIWHLVLTIIAAIKCYDGQLYRYPLTLRLV